MLICALDGARTARTVLLLASVSLLLPFGSACGMSGSPPAVAEAVLADAPVNGAEPLLISANEPTPPASRPVSKPLWNELTPAQQQALAPLATEWDTLEAGRKSKWLAISSKYSSMKPEKQQRLQERMREWVKLTPEQRRIARENYARAKKLNPDQKSQRWEQYQQLSDEQKSKLATDAASRKNVATPPSRTRSRNPTLPPIKSEPKPAPGSTVTHRPANPPVLPPSPQPVNR